MKKQPSKKLLRFFRWFCHPDLHPYIEGDLIELFQERAKDMNTHKANRILFWDIIKLFRPSLMKPLGNRFLNYQIAMLQNNVKMAFRVFKKTRFFTGINLSGLILGFVVTLLILAFVNHETSYDKHFENSEEIFRLITVRKKYDKLIKEGAKGPTRVHITAPKDVAGIKNAIQVYPEPCLIRTEKKKFVDQKVYWVSENFFKVFKGGLILGQANSVLDAPLKMVITESKSKALFGDENPIGKQVKVNEGMPFVVSGIVKDPPSSTHFKYEYLCSISTFVHYNWATEEGSWNWDGRYNYITINPNLKETVEASLNSAVLTHVVPDKNDGNTLIFKLQNVTDIHLKSNFSDEMEVNSDIKHIYVISIIGIAILLIVFVNFINLSISLSLKRAKEIGVRKTYGVSQGQIRRQYFVEASILSSMALLGAIIITAIIYKPVESLLNINLDFAFICNPIFLLTIAVVYIICLIAIGFYPAIILSSFNPIKALKGESNNSKSKTHKVKQALLTIQFMASIFLITGAYVVYKQVKFMKDYDLGMKMDQVLMLFGPTTYNVAWNQYEEIKIKKLKYNTFKENLLKHSFVKEVGAARTIPGEVSLSFIQEISLVGEGEPINTQIERRGVDQGFFPVYDVQFISGENFREDLTNRQNKVILNQKAVKLLGFDNPEEAINKEVKFWNGKNKIIGVVNDFHMRSLEESSQPIVFFNHHPNEFGYYLIKINSENVAESLAVIKKEWKELYPEDPFKSFFSDKYFDRQYEKYEQFGKLFNGLTVIAIFLANLGLFALVSLIASEKLKEISVRKILGASWSNILFVMSKNFILLIVLATSITLPASYYFLSKWLNGFHYKIELPILEMIACSCLILLVSLVNIVYYVVKVLKYNPSEILANE